MNIEEKKFIDRFIEKMLGNHELKWLGFTGEIFESENYTKAKKWYQSHYHFDETIKYKYPECVEIK